jgi:hypothetical protein
MMARRRSAGFMPISYVIFFQIPERIVFAGTFGEQAKYRVWGTAMAGFSLPALRPALGWFKKIVEKI